MKKIEKTRDDAIRMQQIKESKIKDLQGRIRAEQANQDDLNKRMELAKEKRELIQA